MSTHPRNAMERVDPRIEAATDAFTHRQPVGTAVLFDDMQAALAAADRSLLSRLPLMRDAQGTLWVELAALKGLLSDGI